MHALRMNTFGKGYSDGLNEVERISSSRSMQFGMTSTSCSSDFLTNSSATEHGCEEDGHESMLGERVWADWFSDPQHLLLKRVDDIQLSPRATQLGCRSRAEWSGSSASHRSLPPRTPVRSSIGSKSTAVDSVSSLASRSPPPSSSGSHLRLTPDHRSISPSVCTYPSSPSYRAERSCLPSQSRSPLLAPTCPLPGLPSPVILPTTINAPIPSPPSVCGSLPSSPLAGLKSNRSIPPRSSHTHLPPLVPLHRIHPSTSYRQHLGDDFYDDDPFAAEKIVVSRPFNQSTTWSDDESVDPMLHPSRPNSLYTVSESCYSVNTTLDKPAGVGQNGPMIINSNSQQLEHPPGPLSDSEESQECPITPSPLCEDATTASRSGMSHLHRMTLPLPTSLSKQPRSSSLEFETFSFGQPNRFDGLFFGYHRRPDTKYHPNPTMILGVSPPLSSSTFSPGDTLDFKLSLSTQFDNLIVSFVGESRLIGGSKIRSHRFLKHEIDLVRPGTWACWDIREGKDSKEWLVRLKIPNVTNCNCRRKSDQEDLTGRELPSSTINNQVFISYHLLIRGIGKQKKNDKPTTTPRRRKKEERVRLTVMIKNRATSDSSGRQHPWTETEHNHSCIFTD